MGWIVCLEFGEVFLEFGYTSGALQEDFLVEYEERNGLDSEFLPVFLFFPYGLDVRLREEGLSCFFGVESDGFCILHEDVDVVDILVMGEV